MLVRSHENAVRPRPPFKYEPNMKKDGRSGVRNSARKRPLTMKNGQHHVVLLAGGPADLAEQIRYKLGADRGIYVKYHWESDKEHQWDRPLPDDIDFVIFLKDFASHSMEKKVIDKCKASNMRWVKSGRKLTQLISNLQAHDILAAPAIATLHMKWERPAPGTREPEPPPAEPPVQLVADAAPVEEEATTPDAITLVEPVVAPLQVPTFIHQQVSVPIDIPEGVHRGIPSPRLAAAAAMIMRMCAEEGVSVLVTGTELTFTATS